MLRMIEAHAALRLLSALLSCLALASCAEPEPFLVGFSGPLESTYSDLGVQGRNGLQLAIEEINAAGGVGGRQLQLLAHDDGTTPESAREANRTLIAKGVKVIIGHMTSGQTVAGLPVAEAAGVTMISPTTATPLLTAQKDHFFRVIPSATQWAQGLARHCLENDGIRKIASIADLDNEAYATPFNHAFAERFRAGGGTVAAQLTIRSSAHDDWSAIIDQLKALDVPAVQVALSARDLAELARQLRHKKLPIRIYSAMWAYTNELIQAGGKAAEGIVFAVSFAGDNDRPEFLAFSERYFKRFGWKPNFAAAFGYECGMLLAEALQRAKGDPGKLPQTLPEITDFQGVIGPFGIDEYGDVERPSFIVTIADRQFKTIALIGKQ